MLQKVQIFMIWHINGEGILAHIVTFYNEGTKAQVVVRYCMIVNDLIAYTIHVVRDLIIKYQKKIEKTGVFASDELI